jgi:hypothetical protein
MAKQNNLAAVIKMANKYKIARNRTEKKAK